MDYREIVQAYMPEYPRGARDAHTTGSGVVVMEIDISTGNVVSCHMDPSTGNDELDEAALQAFRQWRFKPGIHSQVMPLQVVPPPPDHESILRIKAPS